MDNNLFENSKVKKFLIKFAISHSQHLQSFKLVLKNYKFMRANFKKTFKCIKNSFLINFRKFHLFSKADIDGCTLLLFDINGKTKVSILKIIQLQNSFWVL